MKKCNFMPPVKRYMNAIEWRLKLPWKVRVRVMSDLATSMEARHEAGETYEAIMAGLGAPAEVAARLNKEMAEYAAPGSPWRWLFLALAVLAGAWTLYQLFWLLLRHIAASMGVIGGADGPTAIFVSTAVRPWVSPLCGLGVTVLAAVFYRILRKRGGGRA